MKADEPARRPEPRQPLLSPATRTAELLVGLVAMFVTLAISAVAITAIVQLMRGAVQFVPRSHTIGFAAFALLIAFFAPIGIRLLFRIKSNRPLIPNLLLTGLTWALIGIFVWVTQLMLNQSHSFKQIVFYFMALGFLLPVFLPALLLARQRKKDSSRQQTVVPPGQ